MFESFVIRVVDGFCHDEDFHARHNQQNTISDDCNNEKKPNKADGK